MKNEQWHYGSPKDFPFYGNPHKHKVFGAPREDGTYYAPLAEFADAHHARLSAAAPDMLAALEEIAREAATYSRGQIHSVAAAAIRRAKGEG